MKFCSECGAANENDAFSCYECGAELPAVQTNAKKGRKGSFRIPKPVLIGAAAVLALALVVGLVFGVIALLSGGEDDLGSAFGQTMGAFRDGEKDQTQLQTFMTQVSGCLADGEYTFDLTYDGVAQLYLRTDYSYSDKQLQGRFNIMGTEFAYSANEKLLQFTIPGQFDNVYGIRPGDLDKLLDDPLLSQIAGLFTGYIGMDLQADMFPKPTDLEGWFKNAAGDEYEAFLKSVEITEMEEERVLDGRSCRVYEITWSSAAANELISAVGSLGKLPQIGELLNVLVPELDPECRCYVNDGYLIGLEFVSAGAQCLFVLEGEENPWDAFSLTVNSVYGESLYYHGALERSGESRHLYLEGEGETLLSLDYNDATGEFAVYTRDTGDLLRGQVTAGSEATLRLEWNAGEAGVQALTFTLSELRGQPGQLSADYIDLLEMSLTDLTRFLLDLGGKLN